MKRFDVDWRERILFNLKYVKYQQDFKEKMEWYTCKHGRKLGLKYVTRHDHVGWEVDKILRKMVAEAVDMAW